MVDENKEMEPFDIYVDQFTISLTPFGANLSFGVREAHPPSSRAPQVQNLCTIRMSVEHLKTMVMILRRQICKVENETGVKAEVPANILNQLGIPLEDWNSFWQFI